MFLNISEYIRKQGKQEMINFMKSMGGFPMLEGDSWNALNFNRSKNFENFPLLMSEFLNMGFQIKKDETNSMLSRVTVMANQLVKF
jgi:hypothetical protein